MALYSADRPVQFVHMRLELKFTDEGLRARTCEGRVEYTLRPRVNDVQFVRLNAVGLSILGVELPGNGSKPEFSYDDRVLTIKLPRPAGPENTFKLAVTYRVSDPPKGMHFILPSASEPKKPLMVYTMSEPIEARYWVPAHDWPNERWTTDMIVKVPSRYTVVANGVLRDKQREADGRSIAYHWHNEVPTDPHLMGLVLGELVELKSSWRGKPILIYTQPGLEKAAGYTFRRVPEILDLYCDMTGVDFPYQSYTHVTVVDHHHGGMEHAGFSFVHPRFLAGSEDGDCPLEFTESNYISHMLAHQWFGGIVNYRSIAEAWLNEGFAILLDSNWTSHTDSPDRFPCKMYELARRIALSDTSENGKPMVYRDLKDPYDIYLIDGSKVYYKGGWVLNMLRHRLGDKLFRQGVANYLGSHRWQGVETGDLRRALEAVSGQDLEQFFQQWVYGHGVPRLQVEYAWDLPTRKAKVTVRQTQKIDASTPAFNCPLDLLWRVAGQDKCITVHLAEPVEEYSFDFPTEPTLFCIDPHGKLLKTLKVRVPHALSQEQTRTGPTALARLMAIEDLAEQSDADALPALQEVLSKESEFWMVRQAAARDLGRRQTEPALGVLLSAEKNGIGNARVLAAVIEALGRYAHSTEARIVTLRHAESAPSLYVQTAAVQALGRLPTNPALVDKSLKVLEAIASGPARRHVRTAAIESLARLGDPRAYDTLLMLAQPARNEPLRPEAIRALGQLGRHVTLRELTGHALRNWLDDPDRLDQEAVITALGVLGDPRARDDLQRIRDSGRAESLRQAAERALTMLNPTSANPRGTDIPRSGSLGGVRERGPSADLVRRLAELEKQNQTLQNRLKALEAKGR